jgi:F0F1-type ATP synthase membrane subunit c/vacuolar-type H+-ATPase subunit K
LGLPLIGAMAIVGAFIGILIAILAAAIGQGDSGTRFVSHARKFSRKFYARMPVFTCL